jgi:hypothetical protein
LDKQISNRKIDQDAKLSWIYSEACRAWEHSKQPRKRAVSKTAGDDQGAVDTQETREAIDRDGNTEFLYVGMKALQDIRSLWGLDVQPASQDGALSVAALVVDITNRATLYEERVNTLQGE